MKDKTESLTRLTYESLSAMVFNEPAITKIVIEQNVSDLTLDEFLDTIIRPLLGAIGYSSKVINEYLGEY